VVFVQYLGACEENQKPRNAFFFFFLRLFLVCGALLRLLFRLGKAHNTKRGIRAKKNCCAAKAFKGHAVFFWARGTAKAFKGHAVFFCA